VQIIKKGVNNMEDKTYSGDFLAGFIVGALVGAAAALLFAPQSGEETRALIREKGIELQERSAEMSADARMRAGEFQAQAKEKAGALSAQTKETAAGLQTKVKQSVHEGKSAGTQKKEELLTQLDQPDAASEAPAEA
jgi:gas vesicle protein